MDLKDIETTSNWELYQKGKSYLYMQNAYSDTDLNFRMYNGNQNEGIKVKSIEPIQLNFIKPIVKYKVAVINQNLWGIVYNSENFEDNGFLETAIELCKVLNQQANNFWEKDRMDHKVKRISKNAAINDESIVYFNYDEEEKRPKSEILSKVDIYYGDEQNDEIQEQPYILIRQRKTVSQAREFAKKNKVSADDIEKIIGDNQTFEESGENSKYELDDKVTLITKLYKKNKNVYYTISTEYVDIVKDVDSQLKRYPLAHFIWEEKEGSARGEGEVRQYIHNQIEVNKTLMRRALVTKITAYPQKIARIDKIDNKESLDQVGGIIKVRGNDVDDVKKVFGIVQPSQMSPDVQALQKDLIETTRNLANAGDIATGSVNPDTASGRAILAVQNASQQPLSDQQEELKDLVEQIALIWLDMIITYNQNGLVMQYKQKNPQTGEETIVPIKVTSEELQQLKASVKIDITPKSAYDKYARELSLENLLKSGYFNTQRLPELELYASVLPDDSTMPKQALLEIIKKEKEKQAYIAKVDVQTQRMFQNANQFINSDPDSQASRIAEAQQNIQNTQTVSNEPIINNGQLDNTKQNNKLVSLPNKTKKKIK